MSNFRNQTVSVADVGEPWAWSGRLQRREREKRFSPAVKTWIQMMRSSLLEEEAFDFIVTLQSAHQPGLQMWGKVVLGSLYCGKIVLLFHHDRRSRGEKITESSVTQDDAVKLICTCSHMSLATVWSLPSGGWQTAVAGELSSDSLADQAKLSVYSPLPPAIIFSPLYIILSNKKKLPKRQNRTLWANKLANSQLTSASAR